jgi:hypothetical protein
MIGWFDQNSGADGWAITPSEHEGRSTMACRSISSATLASAFVARCCAGYKVETAEGVFRIRPDEATPRLEARMYRTPCTLKAL